MNSKRAGLAAMLLVGLVPAAAFAQEFSADVAYLTEAGRPGAAGHANPKASQDTARLYASKESLRLETRGISGTILLTDRAAHTAFALYPSQKAYQPLTSGPSQYFRVAKADDACADWRSAASQKISCEKVGPETVAGRHTIKYVNKGASVGGIATLWIDANLNFPIKWEGPGASAELRNIKEGKQAAELFAVPPDYVLMTPQKAKTKGFGHKSGEGRAAGGEHAGPSH